MKNQCTADRADMEALRSIGVDPDKENVMILLTGQTDASQNGMHLWSAKRQQLRRARKKKLKTA
jgi:hypothetical protein